MRRPALVGTFLSAARILQVDTRAGHYERKFHSKAGEVNLKMPLAAAQARPSIRRPLSGATKRRETSIEEALMEMCLAGVSVRQVEDITGRPCRACGVPGQFRHSQQA